MIGLEEKKGKKSFVYTGENPWWGVGNRLPKEEMTSERVIIESGMDYNVELGKIFTNFAPKGNETGSTINLNSFKEVKEYFATYRTDTNDIFSIVGDRYNIIQNVDAFNFIDEIVGRKEAIYETAGVLFNGSRSFISCKLPSYIHVKGSNDIIENYFIVINDFTGKKPLYALFSPIRPVCYNTVNAALKNCENKKVIRHTANALDRMKEAAELMGVYNDYMQVLESTFNKMADKKIDVRDFVYSVFLSATELKAVNANNKSLDVDEVSTKKTNIINGVIDYYNTDSFGQDMPICKGTLYGAYQAVTGYYNNMQSYSDKADKLNSVWFGNYAKINQKAMDTAELILS